MNNWETKARILYKDHSLLNKAIAAGKNIDNSLKGKSLKDGKTNFRFPMDQYLAYFDYDSLKNLGIANRISESFKNNNHVQQSNSFES